MTAPRRPPARVFGVGTLPQPSIRYDRDNEAQFRREIERRLSALATTANEVSDRVVDNDWLDVRDFGAVGDGLTDDAPAIQAALDFAKAQMRQRAGTDPKRVVFLPPRPWGEYYRLGKPLHVGGPIALRGSRGHGHGFNFGSRSVLGPVFQGPAVVVSGADAHIPLDATPINNGNGSWFYSTTWEALGYPTVVGVTSPQFGCFDFRDAADFDVIHGLDQLTITMVFQAEPGMTVIEGSFLQAVGRWLPEERDEAGAFALIGTNDSLVVRVRTTDGVFQTTTAGGHNLGDGNPHNIELEYDGPNSTLTAFVDGVPVGSVAATGTIEMHPAEGIMLGDQYNIMPYVSSQARSPAGHYGHMKFSTIARYNGADHSAWGVVNPSGVDADTLTTIDWSRTHDGPLLEIGTTPHGKAFIWWRGKSAEFPRDDLSTPINYLLQPAGWSIEDITVENVHGTNPVLHSGVFVGNNGSFGHITRLSVINGARVALQNGSIADNFMCHFEQVYLSAYGGGRYAYLGGHNDTLTTFDDMWCSGGMIPFYTYSGSKLVRNLFIEVGNEAYYGLVVGNFDLVPSPAVFDNLQTNAEAGIDETIYGAALLVIHGGLSQTMVTCRGGGFEQFGFNKPLIQLRGPAPEGYTDTDPGVVVTLRDMGLHIWGGSIPVDESVDAGTFRAPYASVLFDRCVYAGLPPRVLSTTVGAARLEMPGSREVVDYAGRDATVVDVASGTSATDVSSFDLNVATTGGVENPLMLVAVQYKANAQGELIASVLLNPGTPAIQQAMTPIYRSAATPASGDIVLEVYAIRTHRLGATEVVRVQFNTPVASGSKILVGAVCLKDTLPLSEMEVVQWASAVSGTHTVHADDYETTRDGVLLLDFIAGGGAGAPVQDGGQTSVFAFDGGGGQVLGCSSKLEATAAAGTMGQTLGSSATTSRHMVLGVRSAAPVFDLLRGDVFHVTLTQDVLSSHLVHAYEGMRFTVVVKQNTGSPYAFAWPANTVGAPDVTVGAQEYWAVEFVVNSEGVAVAI